MNWNNTNFTKTEAFNDRFDNLGVGSFNFFDALSGLWMIILLTILCQFLIPVFIKIAELTNLSSKMWFKIIRESIFK